MTQLIATTILSAAIPAAPASIDTGIMYIPFLKFGHIRYVPEREIGRLREGELVADMLDAQITDVVRVLAVDLIHCTSWDATRDIADSIFNHLIRTGSNIPPYLIDFLEANISMNELAPYLRKLAA